MKKLNFWVVAAIIGLLVGIASWWTTTRVQDSKDPLNKYDAFVFSENGKLYWLDLKSRRGNIQGKLYRRTLIEEIGEVPRIEENKYPLSGGKTDKGYAIKINIDRKIEKFDAWFYKGNLLVQKHGEIDNKLYQAVTQKELDEYVKDLQHELENAIYHSEEKEKKRIRDFFTELRNQHGFISSTEDGKTKLYLKINEALLEGELSASLLVIDETGKENKYVLNGITDGLIVRLYTTIDGKETKLNGNFHGTAKDFDLSFWKNGSKLSFHAVTEDEYKNSYKDAKTSAQK